MQKRITRFVSAEATWILLALALGAIRAFATRHQLNHDGLNYIDMAQASLRLGPEALINLYWSPGYPALLAVLFGFVEPTAARELPAVHALNFGVFVLVCIVGRLFIRGECAAVSDGARASADPFVVPVSWALLITVALGSVGVGLVAPDLSVMALVLAAAVCFRRAVAGRGTTGWAAMLGVSLGLAFWMKAVMLPLGAALIGIFWIAIARKGKGKRQPAAALIAWLAVVVPLLLILSSRAGRPTAGAVGGLAWSWNINHAPGDLGWTDARFGVPAHPPRLLLTKPRMIEFSAPIGGTYPISYDPSYWYEGLTSRFSLQNQLEGLSRSVNAFGRWFAKRYVIVFALLGLAWGARKTRWRLAPPKDLWSLTTWSFLALALYSAVLVEPRYVAPFLFLLLAAAARGMLRHCDPRTALAVATGYAFFIGAQAVRDLARAAEATKRGPPPYLAIAAELQRAGIRPGDQLAVIGEVLPADWAHAVRARVTALIVEPEGPLAIDSAGVQALRSALAAAGVRTLVSRHAPTDFAGSGWRYLSLSDGTRFAMLDTTR